MGNNNRVNICVDGKPLLCDDFILMFKDNDSNKVEIVTNVSPGNIFLMIYPLVEYITDILESTPY